MKKRKLIKNLVLLAVYSLVGVFVYLTLRSNIDEISTLEIESVWPFIFAIVAFGGNFVVNAFSWVLLMRYSKSGRRVSVMDSLDVYISSFVVRYIPGNVWAIAARAGMNKEHGVAIYTSIWGWILENGLYLLVGLMVSLLVLFNGGIVPEELVYAVLVVLPVLAIFLLRYELLDRLVNFVLKKKFPKEVKKEVERFELSFVQRGALVLVYLGSWLFFSLQFAMVVWGVTGSAEAFELGNFVRLAGINSLAWSVGYLSLITPSGTGVREGIMIAALGFLGLAGGVEAVLIAVVARITAILGELLLFSGFKLFKLISKNDERTN